MGKTHGMNLSHLSEGHLVKPIRLGQISPLVFLDQLDIQKNTQIVS